MSYPEQTSVGMLVGAEVMTTAPGASLVEVAKVIRDEGVGALVVGTVDDVVGVVSERDIVRAVADGLDLEAASAADVASTELVWADIAASIDTVALEMSDRWVRHVLVEDGGTLVGIVSARDLLGAYAAAADTPG